MLDPRLSNTASNADYWLPTWPGSEAAVLLAMANVTLQEDRFDAEFLRRWVNWEEFLRAEQAATELVDQLEHLRAETTQYRTARTVLDQMAQGLSGSATTLWRWRRMMCPR